MHTIKVLYIFVRSDNFGTQMLIHCKFFHLDRVYFSISENPAFYTYHHSSSIVLISTNSTLVIFAACHQTKSGDIADPLV